MMQVELPGWFRHGVNQQSTNANLYGDLQRAHQGILEQTPSQPHPLIPGINGQTPQNPAKAYCDFVMDSPPSGRAVICLENIHGSGFFNLFLGVICLRDDEHPILQSVKNIRLDSYASLRCLEIYNFPCFVMLHNRNPTAF